MDDIKKILICVLASITLLASTYWIYNQSRGSDPDSTDHLERTEEGIDRAERRLSDAERETEALGNELDRASETGGRLADTADTSKEIAGDIDRILTRSEGRAKRIQNLIEQAERADQERRAQESLTQKTT